MRTCQQIYESFIFRNETQASSLTTSSKVVPAVVTVKPPVPELKLPNCIIALSF